MLPNSASFQDFRLKAARSFAHTMIVVDDEASQPATETEVTRLRPPIRISSKGREAAVDVEKPAESRRVLDVKSLIDNAMDLGLICSVLCPRRGENVRKRVKEVAKCADIVCLDWEIYNDGGSSATTIIKDIVLDDAKKNGRLRLIAIYTGDTTNIKILEKVFDAFSQSFRTAYQLKREQLYISGKNGLRIVCLFKTHGIQLPEPRSDNQVSEDALPARLQEEFAALAEGLLSNVALATIAAIRSSSHHVLSKISGAMDGPYFHHRAMLQSATDAEEYAVDVVLSELKSAVDKQDVAKTYAGPNALAARIRDMAAGSAIMTLKYEDKSGPKAFDLNVDDAVKLITHGYIATYEGLTGTKPSKKIFEEEITTLFSKDRKAAHAEMLQFAALTGVRSHPGSHLYKDRNSLPALGLGTIIQDPAGMYLLCLQASCDSVRVKSKSAFLFIPLNVVGSEPDHVVPILRGGKMDWVRLAISRRSYATAKSIDFLPSPTTQTVVAGRIGRRRGFYFSSADGVQYRWIASLKQRRALRSAQRIGQDMGRLGFDEFEPFRK
jgi:hypothetical protein